MSLKGCPNVRNSRFARVRGQSSDLNSHIRLGTVKEFVYGGSRRTEGRLKAQPLGIVGGSVPLRVYAHNPEWVGPALGGEKTGKCPAYIAIADQCDPQLLRVAAS